MKIVLRAEDCVLSQSTQVTTTARIPLAPSPELSLQGAAGEEGVQKQVACEVPRLRDRDLG
jgi:hypothetical protein